MIPLQLTAREQNLLAQFCQEMSRAIYDIRERHHNDPSKVNWDAEVKKLGDNLMSSALLDTKSQEWGTMYDKLHRSGANS